jgi:hypothetical protein
MIIKLMVAMVTWHFQVYLQTLVLAPFHPSNIRSPWSALMAEPAPRKKARRQMGLSEIMYTVL